MEKIMNSKKETEKVFDQLLIKLGQTRSEFLDKANHWWCGELRKRKRKEPIIQDPSSSLQIKDIEQWKKGAKDRLEKYYEIEFDNLTHVTRDDVLPGSEFDLFEQKVLTLKSLQENAGLPHPHPSLWGEYGRGAIRARKLDLAEEVLSQCIEWLSHSRSEISLRDCVRYYSDFSRCASLANKDTVAVERAKMAMSIARNLNKDREKESYIKYSGIPWDFHPAITYAFFSSMDARISSEEWNKTSTLQDEFTYFWRKSLQELDTPKSWSPILKIAVVSDNLWVERMNNYAGDIAKDLYVMMADSKCKAVFRTSQITWWEISPNLSKLSKSVQVMRKVAVITVLVSGTLLGALYPSGESFAITYSKIDYSAPAVDVIKRLPRDSGIPDKIYEMAMEVENDTPGITIEKIFSDVQQELINVENRANSGLIMMADGGSDVGGM